MHGCMDGRENLNNQVRAISNPVVKVGRKNSLLTGRDLWQDSERAIHQLQPAWVGKSYKIVDLMIHCGARGHWSDDVNCMGRSLFFKRDSVAHVSV